MTQIPMFPLGRILIFFFVILVIVGFIWLPGFKSLTDPARPGHTFDVGPRDEVAIQLPPYSWFDLVHDKPILIRLGNGKLFERRPDGRTLDSNGTEVSSIGDTIPGSVIYVRAKERMARVTVTTVRK